MKTLLSFIASLMGMVLMFLLTVSAIAVCVVLSPFIFLYLVVSEMNYRDQFEEAPAGLKPGTVRHMLPGDNRIYKVKGDA